MQEIKIKILLIWERLKAQALMAYKILYKNINYVFVRV